MFGNMKSWFEQEVKISPSFWSAPLAHCSGFAALDAATNSVSHSVHASRIGTSMREQTILTMGGDVECRVQLTQIPTNPRPGTVQSGTVQSRLFSVSEYFEDGGTFGKDTTYAGTGNDLVVAGGGEDFVYGGTGNDILIGVGGSDTLLGDQLYGEAGNDVMLNGNNFRRAA